MPVPVVDRGLVERIERVTDNLWNLAMLQTQAQPGNPFGVDVARFGNATASTARRAGSRGWWHRVKGFSAADLRHLPELLGFYRRDELRCWIDLSPLDVGQEMGRTMAGAGLYAAEASTILYGTPETICTRPTAAGIEVREVGPEQQALVAKLWSAGFEIPPGPDRDTMQGIRQGAFAVPANRRYIAYVDGAAAGMAAMYVEGGVGYLNVGATLPPYRRRGCHAALTARRTADALTAGCDLIIGHTGFALASQNNEERAGLRIAYNHLSWVDGID